MKCIHSIIALMLFVSVACQQESDKHRFSLVSIPAPSLKGNLVGTDTIQQIAVNLPESYYKSNKRYPVVYFLSGYGMQAKQFVPVTSTDSLMIHGHVNEMIYVEVSGYNLFHGSMYTNSAVTGNWEDYVVKDVVGYIDANYRTLNKKESRAIVGHSMGGAGTIAISMKYPDLFSVAYAMSPATSVNNSFINGLFPNSEALSALNDLAVAMKDVDDADFAEKIDYHLRGTWLYMTVAYGAAYAPDTASPLKMALPYKINDDGTFSIDSVNYQKWESGFGNLEQKVKEYKDNLKQYRHYAVDCGYQDGYQTLVEGAKKYSYYLSEEEIPHSLHLYTGDHVNKVGEQLEKRVIPLVSDYLDAE